MIDNGAIHGKTSDFYQIEMDNKESLNYERVESSRFELKWTEKMDFLLIDGIQEYGYDWDKISLHVGNGATVLSCQDRWNYFQNKIVVDSLDENWITKLKSVVEKSISNKGMKRQSPIGWNTVASEMNRTEYECQQKWSELNQVNYKKGNFTKEEDFIITQRVHEWGNRGLGLWVALEKELGRKDKRISERWRLILSKKMQNQGNDPFRSGVIMRDANGVLVPLTPLQSQHMVMDYAQLIEKSRYTDDSKLSAQQMSDHRILMQQHSLSHAIPPRGDGLSHKPLSQQGSVYELSHPLSAQSMLDSALHRSLSMIQNDKDVHDQHDQLPLFHHSDHFVSRSNERYPAVHEKFLSMATDRPGGQLGAPRPSQNHFDEDCVRGSKVQRLDNSMPTALSGGSNGLVHIGQSVALASSPPLCGQSIGGLLTTMTSTQDIVHMLFAPNRTTFKWTSVMDEVLTEAVRRYSKNWVRVSEFCNIPGADRTKCRKRWARIAAKVQKNDTTNSHDQKLVEET